jgi:hypothetical protein
MRAVSNVAGKVAAPIDNAVNQLPDGAQTIVHGAEEAIPDIAGVLGLRAGATGAAATNAETAAARATREANSTANAAANPTGAPKSALFTPPTETNQWARAVAGSSGKDALNAHYQKVGNAAAAGEANVPAGTALTAETLEAARAAPNTVYDTVAKNLPEGQLDEAALKGVNSAGATQGGLVTSSDAAKAQIQSIKDQLNQPMSGQQVMDNLRSLRQEGFKRSGSEDVDQQAVGRAQLDMANAMEGHVARNLPQGGPVSLDQFHQARQTLAKNHAVEAALRGNDVDMGAVARMQRNGAPLTGGLKEIADFADGPGRGYTGLPNAAHEPTLASDVMGSVNLLHPVQGAAKFLAGRKARAALTGDTAQAVANAVNRFGAKPDQFRPQPGLTPPPGTAGRIPQQMSLGDMPQGDGPAPWTLGEGVNPSTFWRGGGGPEGMGGGPSDRISLADVLSHGVEQSPPQGLSLAPMGAPAQEGLPFTQDAGHMAGDLSLGGHEPSLADLLSDLKDHAAVMSQGVPEGTAARAPQKRFVGDTVDFPNGTPRRQIIENNASGESAASIEAQRRLASEKQNGNSPFFIDPEGSPKPLARTVDAVDAAAPKGHLKVQKDPTTGKLSIVDRGGLTLSAAKGLLNRYMSLHQSLGDAFGG